MRVTPIRLLLVLTLALSAALAWMWVDEHARLRDVTWVPPAPLAPGFAKSAASAAGSATGSPAQYLTILERPVFAPDRRPPPAAAASAPPDPMANIQLHAIFSGAVAGVIARVDGKLRRVKVNDAIGPWTLKSVDGREATFAQGEETRKVRLAYTRLDTVAAPGAPGGAATTPAASANTGAAAAMESRQEEARERLRRRNEIRAARGLPPVTE